MISVSVTLYAGILTSEGWLADHSGIRGRELDCPGCCCHQSCEREPKVIVSIPSLHRKDYVVEMKHVPDFIPPRKLPLNGGWSASNPGRPPER